LLHLAANPSPKGDWDSLLPDNVVGTYNAFEAARSAGCRGVVYASSCNAVLGYDREQRVRPEDPVSPPNLYGVTKCWGEALGRYMAISEGLAVICIRIGAFAREDRGPKPPRRDPSGIWITAPDLTQLFQHCIDDRRLQFAIVHGLSRNRYNRMEMTETCQLLGFEPEDDLTPELPPKPS
jgi:nucleoside-diphosphate-sugar epimerase